jgi:hypothetical protein
MEKQAHGMFQEYSKKMFFLCCEELPIRRELYVNMSHKYHITGKPGK